MGFFSSIKNMFGKGQEPAAGNSAPQNAGSVTAATAAPADDAALLVALREAEPRLSAWLGLTLNGVEEADALFWRRLKFFFQALEAPEAEAEAFASSFRAWLDNMGYKKVADFASELQYRLALALDLEDEEDERSRLLLKLNDGLAKTRAQLGAGLTTLLGSKRALDDSFWEELEETLLLGDVGYEAATTLAARLKQRAAQNGLSTSDGLTALLRQELADIFSAPRRISAVNPPEVVLMVGVNGSGKTTTIAKLAYRAIAQGKRVLIAAGDTFRAAAIEQLEVWAKRAGAGFYAKTPGADPAAVAFEAMEKALAENYDMLFIDTAGRLQTNTNLMEELTKISRVVNKKHPGAPHRCILILDANTGQNALSQAKIFKEASGIDEIILTKLDGTAKGGVAVAIAMQFGLPITYIGLGEKMEDLRPFDGKAFAGALLGEQPSA